MIAGFCPVGVGWVGAAGGEPTSAATTNETNTADHPVPRDALRMRLTLLRP